jgi:hypothetical protein
MTSEKPNETRREGECFRHLFSTSFGGPLRVLELFAGIGLLASVLDDLDLIQSHEAWDYSQACIERLKVLRPNSVLHCTDSFKAHIPTPGHYDLISADFNSWTAKKWAFNPEYRAVTDRIFKAGAPYVQLTDAAVGWVHLNAKTYEMSLTHIAGYGVSVDPNIPSYLSAVSYVVGRHYGYRPIRIAYHSRAAYILFERGPFNNTVAGLARDEYKKVV